MYVFKRPGQAVLDRSPLQETVLVPMNDFENQLLQTVSQQFSYQFQTTIEQCDGSEIISGLWRLGFWDESYIARVQTLEINDTIIEIIA